jgi:hypothetical protein
MSSSDPDRKLRIQAVFSAVLIAGSAFAVAGPRGWSFLGWLAAAVTASAWLVFALKARRTGSR